MNEDSTKNITEFLRLIMLSYELSLKVTKVYTKFIILPIYNNSIINFLKHNKHKIYHLWNDHTKCCQGYCDAIHITGGKVLNKEQFQKLFNLPNISIPGHFIRGKQYCVCGLSVNTSCSLDQFDITMLHTLIKNCCTLDSDDSLWLDTVRKIRNNLAHVGSVTKFDQIRLKYWWDKLESSVMGLASKLSEIPEYEDSVRSQIDLLKMANFDVIHTDRLLNLVKAEIEKVTDTVRNEHVKTINLISQILDEQTNRLENTITTMKNEIIHHITVKMEELTFNIMESGLEQYKDQWSADKGEDEEITTTKDKQVSGDKGCFVEWKFHTPTLWNVSQISTVLNGTTQLLKHWFKVECVYVGSLIIVTSAPSVVLLDIGLLHAAIRSFLQYVIDVCVLDTQTPETIDVDFTVLCEDDVSICKKGMKQIGRLSTELEQGMVQPSTGSEQEERNKTIRNAVQDAETRLTEQDNYRQDKDEISDINVTNAVSFSLNCYESMTLITGCCISNSGLLIFADQINYRLMTIDTNDEVFKDIPLEIQPFDVAVVDNETVAVTCTLDKSLVLIDITDGEVIRTIYEGERCYGLCYSDGKFFVNFQSQKIKVIDYDGNILSEIDTFGHATYCCVRNNSIFCVAHRAGIIYCCEMNGLVKWKYLLGDNDFPCGIAADKRGNVFVTCKLGNKVIVIDEKGNNSKIILTNEDGMDNPLAISYNEKRNILLVCNYFDETCVIIKPHYNA